MNGLKATCRLHQLPLRLFLIAAIKPLYIFFPLFIISPAPSLSLTLALIVGCCSKAVHRVADGSPWAHVNLSLPPLFLSISSLLYILLLLHFISWRFVLMDFAVILPSMAFSFNGGVCVCVCVRYCLHTCVSLSVCSYYSHLPPPYIIHKC